MRQELVSVIVIAYNIEKYISKCINSIVRQDYENLQIIVVDDGSSDGTFRIVEKLSKKDNRIIPIEKENGGPSSARNFGMRYAEGKYIVFVDGDDYVAKDYISYLYKLITFNNSDFAFSKNLFSSNKQKQIINDNIKIITPEQATALLMSTQVVVGSYNKIYRREFLYKNNIKFNENLFYGEGLSFITTVSQLANNICTGEKRVYFYRKNNSNSATTVFDIHKINNGEKSILRIKNTLRLNSRLIDDMIVLHLSVYYLGAIVNLINYHQKNEYISEYKKWMQYVRKHLWKLLGNSNVSLYRKCMLLGGACFPEIIAKLDVIRRKRIVKNSIQ